MITNAPKEKALLVLRWVAMLPAAIIGSWLAYYLVLLINRVTMTMMVFFDPDSFLGKGYLQWVGNMVLGASFVYISVYIAPSFKKQVGIIMGGLVLLLSGFFLFAAIMTQNYWAIFATFAMNVGSISVAYWIFMEQSKAERGEKEATDHTVAYLDGLAK